MNATAATPGQAAPPLERGLWARLSFMMFLQYAIWGAWLPLLYQFLANVRKFSPDEIGVMFGVGAVGALLAPFVAGQIADRYFATQRFLGVSHLLGAGLIACLPWLDSFLSFLLFSLLYSLVYSPTMPLTNSLAFAHLPDRDRDFGRIRLWGTFGWIAAGIGIGQWLLYHHTPSGVSPDEVSAAQFVGMADSFTLSAILGAVMGVYCFFLPHTPPAGNKDSFAATAAMSEIRHNPLLTLFLLAVPISCIHQFYFVHTAAFLGRFQTEAVSTLNRIFGVGGGGLMTIGQVSELVVIGSIPFLAKRLSRKTLLGIGIAAYAVRMLLFAYVAPIASTTGIPEVAILILGVAMHGLCFGCFIMVAFMIVDEETTGDVRASAQSLFNLVIIGIGIIVGSSLATRASNWATNADGEMDYTRLFSLPMWAAVACLVALLLFYPNRRIARHPD